MKLRIKKVFSYLSIFMLIIASLPTRSSSQQLGPIRPPQGRQMTPALRQKIQAIVENYRVIRREFHKANIPLDPGILFTRNWRQRLQPMLAGMPQMQTTRLHQGALKGAQLAQELRLPEKVDLTGDTVILARRVKFLGEKVTIKGPHHLHIFAIESFGTMTGKGSITIDVSGRGRKEWLESVRQRRALSAKPGSGIALLASDADGTPGSDGTPGNQGTSGTHATGTGDPGDNGSCPNDPNGKVGYTGPYGGSASNDAGNGGHASPGGNAGNLSIEITDPNDTTAYNLSAKGGDGGRGGDGGPGGVGGNGGTGGRGGDGVGCTCVPTPIFGSGGNGGRGGSGGSGGSGGNGGDGKNGGRGGTIGITYPPGYNTNGVTTNVSGGAAGQGGAGGMAGQGGQPGNGGDGGSGGSLLCGSGSAGQTGGGGDPGSAGASTGNSGNAGSPGDSGSVECTQSGGGSSVTETEPGIPYENGNKICVDWYYVFYWCSGGTCTETGRECAFTHCDDLY